MGDGSSFLGIIEGGGDKTSTDVGVNRISGETIIIGTDIQVHVDTMLGNPGECIEYVSNLTEDIRKEVLNEFKQIKALLT